MCNVLYILNVSVALVSQHAKHMHCIILLPVACLAIPNFSTLSHKQHNFWKNITEHKMCVLIFSTNFECNIYHSKKIQSDIIMNVHRSSHKVPVILVGF